MTTRMEAAETLLFNEACTELCDLLDELETGDLTALEMAGLVVILRGAKVRRGGGPGTAAPVLKFVAGGNRLA